MPDLPDDVSETIARITSLEPREEPDTGTGELAALSEWWRGLVGATVVAPVREIFDPGRDIDAATALVSGVRAADRAVDSGATLLVPRAGDRDDTASRALIALLTKKEASAVLRQPPMMSDQEWMARCAAIRDLMAAHRDLLGDQVALLDALGARSIAGMAGLLLGAAARRTPCLIDGTDEWAAALVADRLCHRARSWWRSATTSPDPARTAACDRVGLGQGLPLQLDDEDGVGATSTILLLELALEI